MPIKTYGPYKLKDKTNRRGFRIANPDGKPMVLNSISVIKGVGNNVVTVEVDWVDSDQKKAE